MKKSIIFITVTSVALTLSYFAFAEEHMGGMMQRPDNKGMMTDKGMMGKDMMDKKKPAMCPMHMEMCKSMMTKQIVATEDGGVIVLAGMKLMKYDKDLNLVKETEIKMDMDQMQQKMKSMMEKCPMCSNNMDNGKMGKEK